MTLLKASTANRIYFLGLSLSLSPQDDSGKISSNSFLHLLGPGGNSTHRIIHQAVKEKESFSQLLSSPLLS